MKRILLIFLVFCAFATNAQITQVSGNQSGTWSGEVHLVGDVVVPSSETLTIEAGTSVISDGYFEILVLGNLSALGSESARITFTVADTTGYSNYDDPEAGAWKGFYLHKPETVKFRYCDFSYGKNAINVDGGVMRVSMANGMKIAYCRFHHNTTRRKGGAMYAENSSMTIHDCEVFDNLAVANPTEYTWGVGFQFLKCDLDIHDMVFHGNNSETAYGGGMNIDSCNMTLKNAVFYDNHVVNAGGLGIQRCKDYTVKVCNMLAYNNSVIHYGGGLAMATSDPELNNLTIVHNSCGGGGGGGMQAAFNAEPTLNNCIFWGNYGIYSFQNDSLEYGNGSQIYLWGADNYPIFNNGLVQFGLDSIYGKEYMVPEQYNNMIDADPLFVDELNFDFHLMENSPCVNAGLADLTGLFIPGEDLGGGPRICGGRIDMGCYEFGYADVNETLADETTLFVYPNPLTDNAFCVVNLDRRKDVTLRLILLDGKEIYREECGTFDAGEHQISLSTMLKNIEQGNNLYLLVIDNQSIKIVY